MKTEQNLRLAKIITWLAGGVALVFTVALPLVFLLVSYHQEEAILETESEINARLVGRIVADIPELWRFRTHHLEAFLNRRPKDRVNEIRRIVELDGTLIAQSADRLAEPVIWHGADMFDAGVVVARLEIGRSLRPILYQAVGFAVFGLFLGVAVFAILRSLPLRALRRALAENDQLVESLEKQKTDLLGINKALEESRQQVERSTLSLRQSEQRFTAFMDRSPAIAFIKDGFGRYIYVNKTWEAIYALDWRGKTDAELWPRDNVAMFTESDRRALDAGKATEAFETVLDKDGRPQDWWVIKFPIVDADGKRLLGGMAMDITEQRRRQEKLEEAHTALSHAMPGIARLDMEGRYLEVNDMFAGMLGFDPAELIDTDWSQTVHCEDRPRALASYERMLEVGQGEFEARAVRKDGSIVFSQVLMVKIVDAAGQLTGHHCFMRDIDARKAAEQALRDSELKLRRITAAMPGAVYQFELRPDGQHRFLFISDGIEDLIGYCAAAVVDDSSLLWDAVIAEDKQGLMNSIRRSAETIAPWEFEGRVRLPDQSIKWLRGHSVPEPRRADGGCVWNGIFTDITDRKCDELEIGRLAAIVGSSGDAIISRSLDLKVLTWNAAAERMFGYRADEAIGRTLDFIIPEDFQAEVAQKRVSFMRGERIPSYDTVRLARGGKRIDVSLTQSPIVDVNGRVIAVSLIIRDISERKLVEEKLHYELQLFQGITDSAAESIFITDADGRVTFANPEALSTFGFSAGELLGQPLHEIIHHHHPDGRVYPESECQQQLGGGPENIIKNREDVFFHKNGTQLNVNCSSAPITVDGQMVGTVSIVADISARKRSEAVLQRRESQLAEAERIGQMGSWELDLLTNRLAWSDEIFRIFELDPAEFDASYEAFLALIHPDDRQSVDHAYADSVRNHTPCQITHRLLMADGRVKWLEERAETFYDEEGHARRSVGSVLDITARKQAELAVRANEQSIRRLYEITTAGAIPFETRLRDLLKHACERLAVANGAVTRLLKDAVELRFVHSPRGELAEGAQVPLCNAYCTAAFAADEPICFEHVGGSEMRHHPGYLTLGFESYIGTRIMVRGEIFGALCFVAKEPHRGSFSQADRDFIQLVSAWIGSEFARRQAEENLQKSHDRVRQIVDAVPNFIFVKDRVGRFQLANKAVAEAYGTTVADLVGKTDADFNANAAEVEFYRHKDIQVMDSLCEQFINEEAITDATGKVRWLQTVKRPILDETSGATHVLGVSTDITARKLAEDALRQSEQHLIAAQAIAHLGSWEWDLQTGRHTWSDENYRLFGFEPGAVVPSYDRWANRVHPDDRVRVHEDLQSAFDGTANCDIEFRVVHPNGEIRSVHWRGELFRDAAGNERRMAGTALDITERKSAEDALRQAHDELERRVEERTAELRLAVAALQKTEAMLHQAVDVADVGIFERDHDTGAVYFSPTLNKILGIAVDQPHKQHAFISTIHPQDQERVTLARRQARDPAGDGYFLFECRVIRRDGSIGWILHRAQTFFDGSGDARRPVRTIGVVLDITERKRAEDALRASELRLRHALAVGRMGTWERDLRTGKITWDERVYEIFGIDKNVVVNRDLLLALVHPADLPILEDWNRRSEQDGEDYECEVRFVRPDGGLIWVLTHGGLRRDADGAPTHLAGINYDITERKVAEAALRKLNVQLDQRVAQRTQELAESQAGLRALVAELTNAEERERRRLAVELHDTLAQSLAVVNMYLWRVRELLGNPAKGAPMNEVLANLERTVDDSIKYTRSLIAELSPPVLYDLGLPAAFRWLGEQMGRHGLRVEVDGPVDGFSLTEGDAVFLFQCVRELLWNVVKHGATDRAKIAYGCDGHRLSLAVVDHGKGFDPQSARANRDGGSHFGLFSIRERVELRGGVFEINSAPGAGTWASIVIPTDQKQADSTHIAKQVPLPAMIQPASGDAIKIVIVDDHKMLRQGLRRVLEEQGCFAVVGEAGDGAEALMLARDLEPAVVIMDVNMPSMNGIEATEKIILDRPSTIVIGLSFGTEDYVVRAMQAAGAVTCLPKERAVEDVSQAIMDAVAARRTVQIDNRELVVEN